MAIVNDVLNVVSPKSTLKSTFKINRAINEVSYDK